MNTKPSTQRTQAGIIVGGVLFIADGNPGVYDAKEKELEPATLDVGADNSNKSWMALMMLHYLKVMESRVGPREIIGQTLDDLVPKEPRLQAIGRKTFFDLLNCPEGSTDLSKSRGLVSSRLGKVSKFGPLTTAVGFRKERKARRDGGWNGPRSGGKNNSKYLLGVR